MCERVKSLLQQTLLQEAVLHPTLIFISMTFCRAVLFDEKKEIPEPLNLIQGGDDMWYDNPMLTFVSMTSGMTGG